MVFTTLSTSTPSMTISSYGKAKALEESLKQSVQNFKELVIDLNQLQIEAQEYKEQYLSIKDKCDNKTCTGSEELKKVIATKDQIIHAVASTLTKLNETKNFDMLAEAFKILFEEVPLTPPTDDSSLKTHSSGSSNKASIPECTNTKSTDLEDPDISITEDVSFKEESVHEIEGTPTGRTSPIIHTKKSRSKLAKTELRDKKKCPNDWPTSDPKTAKLHLTPSKHSTPKGSGKLRQSRLNLVKMRSTTVVDLTCSPELLAQMEHQAVQPLIRKESSEYDDTILPSPTSEPTNIHLLKTSTKASPCKFKKPKPLSLKSRCENIRQDENKAMNNTATDMEESINILNQHFANRIREIKKENSIQDTAKKDKDFKIPIKLEISPGQKETDLVKKEMDSISMEVHDDDATNASISLLNHLDQLDKEERHMQDSPFKRPLCENINITNTPPKQDAESSMSVLRPEVKPAVEAVKRKLPELVEPVYKEATVRKKAEKRNLQGWSCEECKNFYGILYKDDPVMLARKITECSKHRGRHNPERPKTPPNFWNPRWTVPEDTEELNRMNNAD